MKFTINVDLIKLYVKFVSEEEKEEEENFKEEEKQKLKELGVDNTWDILTTGEKKRKEPKKKPFRGFN